MVTRKVPPTALTIRNTNEDGSETLIEFGFQRCVEHITSMSPRFRTTIGARRAFRLLSALDDKKVGDDFEWKDEDAAELVAALNEPEMTLFPEITAKNPDGTVVPVKINMRPFAAYLDAIDPPKDEAAGATESAA